MELDSAKTWLLLDSSRYKVDEFHILGSSHVAFRNPVDSDSPISIENNRMYGDKTGTLHIGYNQNFTIRITDPDTPLNLRVYEQGLISLPDKNFLKSVSVHLTSGKVNVALIITKKKV